jgi:hypothetical protein
LYFTYPWASIKDVPATGEVFISQKRTSSNSKLEFSSLLWIRIQPTKMNADPCGSGSTTLDIFNSQGKGNLDFQNYNLVRDDFFTYLYDLAASAEANMPALSP